MQVSAFYGLEGDRMIYDGVPVLPGYGGTYGAESLPEHAQHFFDGDPRGGVVFTLADVWVFPPKPMGRFDLVCWVPVDHNPVPPGVKGFLWHSGAVPVAMTRFGQNQLAELDALYCPHAVDTSVMKPMGRELARQKLGIPQDRFIVGCVAANKGNPSRKNLVAVLEAFAEFHKRHEDAAIYLHTDLTGELSQGVFLPAVIESLGLPDTAVMHPDPYVIRHKPMPPEIMAVLFSAMSVLVNPASGEGFGIPVLEAQSCGVPVITTDFTAMSEVNGAGWKVGGARWWSGQRSWMMLPYVREIVDALEDCYGLSTKDREELSERARSHALSYDIEHVLANHMLPSLEAAQERLDARRPTVARGSRKWSVSIITPWRDHPEFRQEYDKAVKAADANQVLIIDDGSREPVEGAAYRFDENVGFCEACNKGLKLATSDVVVFLNNDIRLLRDDWLDVVLQAIEPGVLAGPSLRSDVHCAVDGHILPYLDGWCLACLRTDFEALGAWDTTYQQPPYYADNDLCLRAQATGMRLLEVPVHLEHLLNGTSDDDKTGRMKVTIENRKLYEQRVRYVLAQSQKAAA